MYGVIVVVPDGYGVSGKESVVAPVEHFDGELLNNGLCLNVQISNHDITVPSAQHFDNVEVNFATKKSHSASGSKRASTEICGRNASEVKVGCGGCTKLFNYITGCDGNTSIALSIVGGKRFIPWCMHAAMV
jgi:hypothetical protein